MSMTIDLCKVSDATYVGSQYDNFTHRQFQDGTVDNFEISNGFPNSEDYDDYFDYLEDYHEWFNKYGNPWSDNKEHNLIRINGIKDYRNCGSSCKGYRRDIKKLTDMCVPKHFENGIYTFDYIPYDSIYGFNCKFMFHDSVKRRRKYEAYFTNRKSFIKFFYRYGRKHDTSALNAFREIMEKFDDDCFVYICW